MTPASAPKLVDCEENVNPSKMRFSTTAPFSSLNKPKFDAVFPVDDKLDRLNPNPFKVPLNDVDENNGLKFVISEKSRELVKKNFLVSPP